MQAMKVYCVWFVVEYTARQQLTIPAEDAGTYLLFYLSTYLLFYPIPLLKYQLKDPVLHRKQYQSGRIMTTRLGQ